MFKLDVDSSDLIFNGHVTDFSMAHIRWMIKIIQYLTLFFLQVEIILSRAHLNVCEKKDI